MTLTSRRLFLIFSSGLAIAVGVCLFIDAFRKPPLAVNGRLLSEWLADLEAPDEKARLAAENAVSLIGARAVPTLRDILNRRDSLLLSTYRKIGPRFPRWAQRQLHLLIRPGDVDLRRKHAAQALGLLGPDAAPAIPDLINALADRAPIVRPAASQALSRIGTDVVPALVQALKSSPLEARLFILSILSERTNELESALPELLDLLAKSENDMEITATIHVLRKLDLNALQPLFDMLGSPNSEIRNRAKKAFASIAEANPSMPFKIAQLYPAQRLPVRSAMADVFEQSSLARHLVAVFMTTVAVDTDTQLQQRGIEWLRKHITLEELDRLLKIKPDPVRQQIRASYMQGQDPDLRNTQGAN